MSRAATHQTPEGMKAPAYTIEQYQAVLESIASSTLALSRLLMMAGTAAEEPYEVSWLIDAAQGLTAHIGGMADAATGGAVYGNAETWSHGPTFAGLGAQPNNINRGAI